MPWTPDDAERHTHKATTWELKELWAKVANECLERTGDEVRKPVLHLPDIAREACTLHRHHREGIIGGTGGRFARPRRAVKPQSRLAARRRRGAVCRT